MASKLIGLTGIFWAALIANLIAGSVAWFWLYKVIDNKMDEVSINFQAGITKLKLTTVDSGLQKANKKNNDPLTLYKRNAG